MESGGDPDLPLEPLRAEGRREFGAQHLECDEAVVLEVPREVDRGHAPAAELALERVAAAQGVREGVRRCNQGLPRQRSMPNLRSCPRRC